MAKAKKKKVVAKVKKKPTPVKKATKNTKKAKAVAAIVPVAESIPTQITQEMIARRAKEIWESKGMPIGKCMENWLEAEAELRSRFSQG